MDLREVAAALYAAAPADFVAERTAAAVAAGADPALAKRIRALRRPTAAAAAVNALIRDDPEVIGAVLDVGDRMRDAFAARDRTAIRDLTRERQRVLQRALSGLGVSAGVRREVEDTLRAAVVDPAAAPAVRSGLLVRSLAATGVEAVALEDAVALPPDDAQQRTPRRSGRQPEPAAAPSPGERRERERRLRSAERSLTRVRAAADALDDDLDGAVDRRSDLEAEVETLDRRLRRAAEELAEAEAAERGLRRRLADARAAMREAEKGVRDATGAEQTGER